jgi:hypothetical protein
LTSWKLTLATALLLLVALAGTAVARADGGGTPSQAVTLPIGVLHTASEQGLDWWKLTLGTRDRITIDFGSTDGKKIAACLIDGTTNDFNLTQVTCNYAAYTSSKYELIAPKGDQKTISPAGSWYLVFGYAGDGFFNCQAIGPSAGPSNGKLINGPWGFNPDCKPQLGYQFAVYVQRYTATTLTAPARAGAGTFGVHGTVAGANAGTVLIQARISGSWRTVSQAKIGSSGAYSAKLRLTVHGAVHLRALYRGDRDHQRSVAARTVSVR